MKICKSIPDIKGQKTAVFFDLDGTLLSDDKSVFEDNITCAKKLTEMGHLVFINTGRSKAYLPKGILELVPFSGMICGASYIEVSGNVLKNDVISPEARKQLLDLCISKDIPIVFEGVNTNYYFKINTLNLKITTDPSQKGQDGYIYIHDFINDPNIQATKATFHKKLQDIDMSEVNLSRVIKFASYGEAIILGNNKANAMGLLVSHLGIDPSHTVSFGDSENDIEMLKASGVAVVMPHGAPAAKENAHIVSTIKEAVEFLWDIKI